MPTVTRSPVLRRTPRRTAGTVKSICDRIALVVAQDFGIETAELYARTRGSPRAALARQVAMYLSRVVFAATFRQIGSAFDRDHSTVAHACHRIEDERDDCGLDARLARLETRCRQPLADRAADEPVVLRMVR